MGLALHASVPTSDEPGVVTKRSSSLSQAHLQEPSCDSPLAQQQAPAPLPCLPNALKMQYVTSLLWRALGAPFSGRQKRAAVAPPASATASAAPSPLAGLPPELLQHCFSFLDDGDRQAGVQPVGTTSAGITALITLPSLPLASNPICRQAVLDVSRGWHDMLAAAPELVPTVRLSCVWGEAEHIESMDEVHGTLPCPACSHIACAAVRTALERLRGLSPRTLSVRLDGYDWSLVSGATVACRLKEVSPRKDKKGT